MSLDFQVFSSTPVKRSLIAEFSSHHPGLVISGEKDDATSIAFARGDETRPLLQIYDSIELEPEEAPTVLATIVETRWMTHISVPAAAPGWGPYLAMDLCRLLAEATKGAAYDPQSDTVFFPKVIHNVEGSEQGRKIDLLNLGFVMPYDGVDTTTATKLLQVIREHYPGARPKRCQLLSGKKQKIDKNDDATFEELWKDGLTNQNGGMLYCDTTPPCQYMQVFFSERRDELRAALTSTRRHLISFTFEATEFQQSVKASRTIINLFCELALVLKPFYAQSCVQPGGLIRRGTVYIEPGSGYYNLCTGKTWLGLPPIPTWLTWFGPPYAQLLRTQLQDNPFVSQHSADTAFLCMSQIPNYKDEIENVFPVLPDELLYEELEFNSKNPFAPQYRAAIKIPF